MTQAGRLEHFRSLFARVDDAYGIETPGAPRAIRSHLTDEVLRAHLEGLQRIGAYTTDADGMADQLVFDDDKNQPDLVKRLLAILDGLEIEAYPESSKSKGYHIRAHFQPAPAADLRKIGAYVAHRAGVPDIEVFPKQDRRSGKDGLGNFMWLPLHGKSLETGRTAIVDRSNGLNPVSDQWEAVQSIPINSLETLANVLAIMEEAEPTPKAEKESTRGRLHLDLIGIGFERCLKLDRYRWNATKEGRLLPDDKTHEHEARIAIGNYCRAFEGGVEWAVETIFRHLDDYDPAKTRKQFASLKGLPPLCSGVGLCPEGQCDDIKALGRKSPIAFAYEARGEANTLPVEEPPPPTAGQETLALDFPAEVMTGAAGTFAHLYSSYLEAPKQFFYMAYLTCLGSYLSGSLTIDSEIRAQPRLYTLLLADSGDDRKSTAITKTTSFFRESIADFFMCRGVGSAEGLQTLLKGAGKKLLLAFDEFMAFVGKCKIESSVLLPCVNTLFEDNDYESRTKKETALLNNAHLSILAASTIATYEKTWSSAFTDIGFNNRLWLVTGKGGRRFSCPRTIPEESKRLARVKLSAVLDHARKHPVMPIADAARELYDDWYLTRPSTIHGKRLDTYALRFMSLLAVNDLKPEVDVETMKKVIALCDHQHRVRQLHDPVDADNVIAGLEEKIRRVLKAKGRATSRDLKRALHVNQTGLWSYNAALDGLIREKEVALDKGHKVYFLQPEGCHK